MNNEKLTPEEIQVLRANAEKERAIHQDIMSKLRLVTMSPELQMSIWKSAYERKRNDEIMSLLQTYNRGDRRYELAPEVKLLVYEHGNELTEAKAYLLENLYLGYEIEKRVYDDKLPPFIKRGEGEHARLTYPKFCNDAEVYMVEETLKACQKADKLTDELKFLLSYIETNHLSNKAEVALMGFLFASTGRDSVLDSLESVVMTYIGHQEQVATQAEVRMIQSGCHRVIMHYITHSQFGIRSDESIEALLNRANREEVTAHFDCYARGN